MPYRARSDETLLEALEHIFQGRSRKDLRRLLADERVRVNGTVVSDAKTVLHEGDAVECVRFGRPKELHPKVHLVYEDDHVFVVDKGAGILTSGGAPRGEPTVVQVLDRYLAKLGVRRTVFACHRLDRGVSGLCLLANEARIAHAVRDDASGHLLDRVYHALVEGVPQNTSGTIRSFLADDDESLVVREVSAEEGKLSVTHYRVVETGQRSASLEVTLETGRKNQIRVHLASIGHPIIGDEKYGSTMNPFGRIALHAARLTVAHPITSETMEFRSPVPNAFARPR
jgi:23S rRNA pseudouridine1911/1915/1917 synthase